MTKIRILRKKLAGGLKIKLSIIIFLTFFVKNTILASVILDHETEIFIEEIISDIKEVNNINKDINFRIIVNNNINAYVDQNNVIYITSGLIQYCEDYVALLSVLAHEIGHIDKNHITLRKTSLKKLKNLSSLSNFSIIAGSMITNNPEALQSLLVQNATTTNFYLNFSKEQEMEADYYSIKTLNSLKLNSISIINLLKTIEKKGQEKGMTKEMQKLSTHPYFEERIDIINFVNNNKELNLDNLIDNRFKFIKAKFLGYTGNIKLINKQQEPFKSYSTSILEARKGNLKISLRLINDLINNHKDNIFIKETKADILYSYGYTNEAINFYEKVLIQLPDNLYTQIRIFENTNFNSLTITKNNKLFIDNHNLLEKFYNNKNILYKYFELSQILKKDDWVKFLYFWINHDKNDPSYEKKLNEFKETKDQKLFDFIEIINKNYS